MTLQDLFDSIETNPSFAIIYFACVPIFALLLGLFSRDEGLQDPWKYIYTGLVYLISIPGIFAVALCTYTFLFLGKSFLEVNVLVYFLPIISMLATILVMKRFVDIDKIPGFGRLSGLMIMLGVIFAIMFVLDRTRILFIAFVQLKLIYVVITLIAIIVLFRFAWSKISKR